MCAEVQYTGMLNILDAFRMDSVMQEVRVEPR